MKTILYYLSFLLVLLISACSNPPNESNKQQDDDTINGNSVIENEKISIDLKEILKSDTLKALTIYSPTSYFIYKGEIMGFEYEVLKNIANKLGLVLKIIIVDDMDKMFDLLNKGEADIIAYGLTVTKERKDIVSFTKPYQKIHQVLIQKDKKNKIIDITQLANKRISVRQNSSYFKRIQNISEEIGEDIYIDTISGEYSTEEIIEMVHKGEIDYTIADNNLAYVNSTYYHDLDMSIPVSLSQNLAWAVRKNSPELLGLINKLIEKNVKHKKFNIVYKKYFKNKRTFAKRQGSEFYSKKTGELSKYDNLIKKYASNINWDWRLLASLVANPN